jgi:hypothetical protein
VHCNPTAAGISYLQRAPSPIHANNEHKFECIYLLLDPADLNVSEKMLKCRIFTFSSSVRDHNVAFSQQLQVLH